MGRRTGNRRASGSDGRATSTSGPDGQVTSASVSGSDGRTSTGVFLYDGDCAFCSTGARFLVRHVPAPAEIVPYQMIDLAGLGLTRQQAAASVWWIGRDGSRGAGPVAVGYLLGEAGRWWKILGIALRYPPVRWLAWPVYHWVSHNRHHLPGGTPTCALKMDSR